MNCKQAIDLRDGYLDGELDPITSQAIEQHLRDCRNCDQRYTANRTLIHAISSAIPYHKAPVGLRERIQSSLREEIAERHAKCCARYPTADREEAARTAIGSFWNLMELAGSCRFHRFRS